VTTTHAGPTVPFDPLTARAGIDGVLEEFRRTGLELPSIVGGREEWSGDLRPITVPHDHSIRLGVVHGATREVVLTAIAAAAQAAPDWSRRSFQERADVFGRAADLLEHSDWRARLTAAAMLELSKTDAQADGDAICEAVDFVRVNLRNAVALEQVQPFSPPGASNHVEYRPLEGFVFAVTPFNSVSMNNLAFGPALLGNTVLWKPAETAALTAHLSLAVLREAGLPDGVINLVHGDGAAVGAVALADRSLAAVHFTGSTATFRQIWQQVGANVNRYRNYPRVVGETGGKDFVLAHPSADVDALAVACVLGAFDYQGQKCAAASRLYVPRSLWPAVRDRITDLMSGISYGDSTRPGAFGGAVISERQFRKHGAALARARAEGLVLAGGNTDGDRGWFVEPTLLHVPDPLSPFMTEELFAPVLAAHVYEDADWEETLQLVDSSSEYGLTGSIFASEERALGEASAALRYAAGNLYLNDKPTGAVVGQQPFGGARASGTNDKAGTIWNLIRFVSPQAIKRNHRPPRSIALRAEAPGPAKS
jgi:1-pyrroline-5-carboxylate dehydrogenase